MPWWSTWEGGRGDSDEREHEGEEIAMSWEAQYLYMTLQKICCFCFQQEPCLVWRRSFKPFLKTSLLSFPSQKHFFDLVSSKKKPFWFWAILWFLSILVFTMPLVVSPKNPSFLFGTIQTFCPNQLEQFLDFYPFNFLPKTILPLFLSLDALQRKCLISFEFWSQTNSSG